MAGNAVSVTGTHSLEIGKDFAGGLPSLAAGWKADGDHVAAWTDRLGFIQIFCHIGCDEIMLADNLRDVASRVSGLQFDFDALSIFFRLGFFLGNDTPFCGIKVLPPSISLRWPDQTHVPEPAATAPRAWDLSRAAATENYIHLFSESCRKRADESRHHVLPLSGGRDSRHIFLELLRLGMPPSAVITHPRMPPFGERDIAIAALLAERAGIPHLRINPPGGGWTLRVEREKNEITHYLSDEGAWIKEIGESLPAEADILFDGLAGGIWGNSVFWDPVMYALLQSGHGEACAVRLLNPDKIPKIFSASITRELSLDRAIARLARELDLYGEFPNPVGEFYFRNRTRREISLGPTRLFPQRVDVKLPYIDEDVIHFLSSLPAESYGEHGFHDEVILKAYPDWADIPFEKKGLPKPAARIFHGGDLPNFMRLISESKILDRNRLYLRTMSLIPARNHLKHLWWVLPAIYMSDLGQMLEPAN
jgi:asparagine synthase (glutamine-hydrolysing)